MPVDQWMGPAAVVDLTHLGENAEVTAVDLDRRAGHVGRATSCSCARTGRSTSQVESERFWSDAPFTGRSACEWLVDRGVKVVGYDYPPDYAIRTMTFSPGNPSRATSAPRMTCSFPAASRWSST